mmetsp:Transcript_44060/g.94429  ORF Transcript_44060/g.94429 Transcript_44060/m.94429 type:complete len:290 (+) Transcript_44060:973-1842(+)
MEGLGRIHDHLLIDGCPFVLDFLLGCHFCLQQGLPGRECPLCGVLVQVIPNARGMVILAIGPKVVVVEDHINGIVGEPLHQIAILHQFWVRCHLVLGSLFQHFLFHLVSGIHLLRGGLHFRARYSANSRQGIDILLREKDVCDLIGHDAADGSLDSYHGVLLPNFRFPFLGSRLGLFPRFALAVLLRRFRPRPPVRHVVKLPGAWLPEGDPVVLLTGHHPDVLHKPGPGCPASLHLFRVMRPDGSFADVGILLGSQQDRAEQQCMVLHRAFPREEKSLWIFPTILGNDA